MTDLNMIVLLRAAEMARPEIPWVIDLGVINDYDDPQIEFNPFIFTGHFCDLERALKHKGWIFGYNDQHKYWAKYDYLLSIDSLKLHAHSVYADQSDVIVLLYCVANINKLEVYTT